MLDHRLPLCSVTELDQIVDSRVISQPAYFEFQARLLRRSTARMLVGRAVAELTQEERRTDIETLVARLELRGARLQREQLAEELDLLLAEGLLLQWRGREYRFRFPLVGRYVATHLADSAAI
jgi:hypothetical protein